ncbi:hypothetical protein BDD14_6536 [Edaphobacter modestus]|uniref:Uncharacterized protein n=1 Tax=Edaphobacter modestus TaxID=388466 RepID=A0A4Q7XXD5_9BACT|nr:hypothetical protein BDD14_6536 [Edaphobacter modestus]
MARCQAYNEDRSWIAILFATYATKNCQKEATRTCRCKKEVCREHSYSCESCGIECCKLCLNPDSGLCGAPGCGWD